MQGSKLNYYLNLFGFFPKKFINSLRGISPYRSNYSIIKEQIKVNNEFHISELYPCLDDRFDTAGSIPQHYFYQDLIVANKIFKANPQKHVDIGSRIDGFVAHVASFREIEVFDIRKLDYKIPNVKFVQADLTAEDFSIQNYCDSISCLHAIEHFGLGRYGDIPDINGHLKGLANISKILNSGGTFYFSTPIGKQRIEFDAHRVFSLKYLIDYFREDYEIKSFSYINDKEELKTDIKLNPAEIENSLNCRYGCGIFELVKK